MTQRMVVDASVAAKWFLLDEPDCDLARAVLAELLAGKKELHAPGVFLYEVCHALTSACLTRGKTGAPRLKPDHALECVRELFGLEIDVHAAALEECTEALLTAVKHSKRHADMSYVYLAEKLDCQWCTADEKVLSAVRDGFPSERVCLLSSMRPAPDRQTRFRPTHPDS